MAYGYDVNARISERACLWGHVPDEYNALVWKERINKIHLKIVGEKISALNEGQIVPNKIMHVIAIARDRMNNYIDEGGSLTETTNVEVNTNGKVIIRKVSGKYLKEKVDFYLAFYASQLAEYDTAEKRGIRARYEATKTKRY